MLHNNLDIRIISETKIESSFPTAQFQIGYTTYKLDKNANGGAILLYIREDIASTLSKDLVLRFRFRVICT